MTAKYNCKIIENVLYELYKFKGYINGSKYQYKDKRSRFIVYEKTFIRLFSFSLILFIIIICIFCNEKPYIKRINGKWENQYTKTTQSRTLIDDDIFRQDTMKLILKNNNMTKYEVKCDNNNDETLTDESDYYYYYYYIYNKEVMNSKNYDTEYVKDKLSYFKKHYLKINNNYYSKNGIYNLNIFNNLTKSSINKQNLENFKICSINWSKHIIAKRFNDSYLPYLKMQKIKYETFKQYGLNYYNIFTGGYHKPLDCLQNFYKFLSEYKKYNKTNDSFMKINELGEKGLKLFKKSIIKLKKSKNLNNAINEISKSSIGILNDFYSLNDKNNNDILKEFNNEKLKFTAIIIPFLNRDKNLIELLLNLHSFLQRQYIHYRIFVAEQFNSNDPFNKGRLYNMAFKYIKNKYKEQVNCFILHDVDLIPESDYNLYECDNYLNIPRHLSFSIRTDKSNTSLTSYINSPYELLVGGVLCIKPVIYEKINGFSNEYWSWGAEDDGMFDL